MVDITNGRASLTVTKGAFEGIYKHQGYILVRDYAGSTTIKPDVTEEDVAQSFVEDVASVEAQLPETEIPYSDNQEPSAEPLKMEELLETPIGQWTKDQLKEFAEANNISLDGATSVKEVRGIIKDFIDSAK